MDNVWKAVATFGCILHGKIRTDQAFRRNFFRLSPEHKYLWFQLKIFRWYRWEVICAFFFFFLHFWSLFWLIPSRVCRSLEGGTNGNRARYINLNKNLPHPKRKKKKKEKGECVWSLSLFLDRTAHPRSWLKHIKPH